MSVHCRIADLIPSHGEGQLMTRSVHSDAPVLCVPRLSVYPCISLGTADQIDPAKFYNELLFRLVRFFSVIIGLGEARLLCFSHRVILGCIFGVLRVTVQPITVFFH